jgi:hypothetical protein
MKNFANKTFLIAVIAVLILAFISACKKDDSPTGTGKTLEFTDLKADKDTIVVQEVTKIKATATGEGITYSWKCDNELGILEGSGAEIKFTICHAGTFKITCDLSDINNHQASKDVYITSIE